MKPPTQSSLHLYCSDESPWELAASGCLFYMVRYNRILFSFSFHFLLTLHLGFTLKRGRGPYVIVRRGVPGDPWRGILARYMPISVSTIDALVGEGSLLPSIGHWLLFGGRPLPQLFFDGQPPLLTFGGAERLGWTCTIRLTNCQVEVILHATPPALAPTAQTPLPNPRAEMPPNEDSDPGLKEVEQFLASMCKPSLIHLLDHPQFPCQLPLRHQTC